MSNYLFSPVFLLLFLLAGCRQHPVDPSLPLEARLATNTETTLREYNDRSEKLLRQKNCDSVITCSRQLLRAFPQHPSGNGDSVLKETRRLLNFYLKSSTQNKQAAENCQLTDSLLEAGHPYFDGSAHYDLLAACTAFHNYGNDPEGTRKLIERFAALPPSPDPAQEIYACHLVANACYRYSEDPEKEILFQKRAVDAYHAGGEADDPADLLSTLGNYYRRRGMYEQAIGYLQEARDWCLAHPEQFNEGFVYNFTDLANLYDTMEQQDKALENISQAIAYSLALDSVVLSDLYRMKAGMFWKPEQKDSARFYILKALRLGEAHQHQAEIAAAKNLLYSFYDEFYPDSAALVVKGFRELCAVSQNDVMSYHYPTFRFSLGNALVKTGQLQEGFPLMEETMDYYLKQDFPEMIDWCGNILLKRYAEHKMYSRIGEIYPVYTAIHDSLQKKEKQRYAIAANIRYETERKEQENRALAAEVALKEQSLVYTRIILGLSGCLLAAGVVYLIRRRRRQLKEREDHRRQLNELLTSQQELNRRNETLSRELEQVSHNEIIDNVRRQLDPTLLSGEDEKRFRQSFAALYPRYLPGLRSRCPELTKSDELFCMLIYLKQNTDEIALALGISRASVNTARSRIRKKFGLQKEDSLDEYLQVN